MNALAILGEYPMIRYYNPNKPLGVGLAYGQPVTKRLAGMVQDAMDRYCRDNEDFPVSSFRSEARAMYVPVNENANMPNCSPNQIRLGRVVSSSSLTGRWTSPLPSCTSSRTRR